MISGPITIVNRLGLHARAAARLVNCASEFKSEIRVIKDARAVNGKSIMGILTLAAVQGTELVLEVDGEDERAAFDALAGLVSQRFGEDA